MGVIYKQYAILGIKINKEDIKRVVSEAIYEERPRYDTRTGEKTHLEKVLVREEEEVYEFMGVSSPCFYELYEELCKAFREDLDVELTGGYNDEECIYIGKKLGVNTGGYSLDGLEGELSLDDLVDLDSKVYKILSQESKLYFWTYCG